MSNRFYGACPCLPPATSFWTCGGLWGHYLYHCFFFQCGVKSSLGRQKRCILRPNLDLHYRMVTECFPVINSHLLLLSTGIFHYEGDGFGGQCCAAIFTTLMPERCFLSMEVMSAIKICTPAAHVAVCATYNIADGIVESIYWQETG